MAEEHLHTDLGTIYYLWEGDGRENEGIDINNCSVTIDIRAE